MRLLKGQGLSPWEVIWRRAKQVQGFDIGETENTNEMTVSEQGTEELRARQSEATLVSEKINPVP